jgi:hypothetical protein
MFLDDMPEEPYENSQIDSEFCDFSFVQLNALNSQYIEIQRPMLSKRIPTLENISEMFTFLSTDKEKLNSLNIDNEQDLYLNKNKSSELQNPFESEPNLTKNDFLESSIVNEFKSEENDDIKSKPNLNLKEEEKIEKIIPSNDKQDRINAITKSFNFIFEILNKINYPIEKIKEIREEIITQKDIENICLFEVKSKKKKNKKCFKNKNKPKATAQIKETNKNKKMKCGRKSLNSSDISEGNHKKECPDNIIKKIKAFLFSRVIKYVQEYININKIDMKEKIKLLTLDYKIVNKLEKKFNLEILKEPLKDLISRTISSKYKNHQDTQGKYFNKKIIKKVLDEEKNNDKINSLLNMSFGQWIDIFTYKKNWEYNIQFKGIKHFLEKIQKNNDAQYFSKVIFYLFNYQKWFLHKKGRNQKKNNKQK